MTFRRCARSSGGTSFAPRKSLGQNFLLDLNLTARDRARGRPARRRNGGRDRARARRAHACSAGAGRAPRHRDRARRARYRRACARSPRAIPGGSRSSQATRSTSIRAASRRRRRARIVANLPYNIATALLVSWLTRRAMAALVRPAGADVPARGRRAHRRRARHPKPMAGCRCWPAGAREARILFDIAPSAFVPPPKVTSSLVRACPARGAAAVRSRGAAAGDRGGLRSAPQDAAPEPEIARRATRSRCWSKPGSTPTARAEDIPVEGFVALARALSSRATCAGSAGRCARLQLRLQARDEIRRPVWRSRLRRSAARMARTSAKPGRVAVDHDIVVFRPMAHLVGGLRHARVDDVVANPGRARCSRRSSSGTEGGSTKMLTRSTRDLFAQLLRALPVDVEQHVAALAPAPSRPARAACRSNCRTPRPIPASSPCSTIASKRAWSMKR